MCIELEVAKCLFQRGETCLCVLDVHELPDIREVEMRQLWGRGSVFLLRNLSDCLTISLWNHQRPLPIIPRRVPASCLCTLPSWWDSPIQGNKVSALERKSRRLTDLTGWHGSSAVITVTQVTITILVISKHAESTNPFGLTQSWYPNNFSFSLVEAFLYSVLKKLPSCN